MLSPEDSQSTVAPSPPENWTGTAIQLQPDLQTETQMPTEAQTEAQTEALQTQSTTSNYTGQSATTLVCTCVQKVFSCMPEVPKMDPHWK